MAVLERKHGKRIKLRDPTRLLKGNSDVNVWRAFQE